MTGFEWDEGNIVKVQKRLDLAVAEFAFTGFPFIGEDEQHSISEKRWCLVNKVNKRHVFVSFTIRGKKIRIISARFMRAREAKKYETWFKQ